MAKTHHHHHELSGAYVKDKFKKNLNSFVHHESFSGILLFFCVVFAMLIANSRLSHAYFELQELKLGVFFGDYKKGMSVIDFINDVAMSLFFLMIGLEMKREILYGELSGAKKVIFPMLGAVGGMIVPIGIYLFFNQGTPSANGFGVAMSTDTAFALGAILLLGKRIPLSLKAFLVTLAVVDDLGAILVIVLFYTQHLNIFWLIISAYLVCVLIYFNFKDTHRLATYLFVGVLLWIAVFNSGIHATIAAVILAFSIPGRSNVAEHYLASLKDELLKVQVLIAGGDSFFESNIEQNKTNIFKSFIIGIKKFLKNDQNLNKKAKLEEQSKRVQILESISKYSAYAQNPLIQLQAFLHPVCSYFVVPLFAFMNAGVNIVDSHIDFDLDYIFVGTVLGLVVGKPLGIFIFAFIGEKCHIALKPKDLTYGQIFATGSLAGIGFTMSIFVANLAYQHNPEAVALSKISILYASSLALIIGVFLLYLTTKPKQLAEVKPQEPQAESLAIGAENTSNA